MGLQLGSGSRFVEQDMSKGLDRDLPRLDMDAKPTGDAAAAAAVGSVVEGDVGLAADTEGFGSTGVAAAKAVASGLTSCCSQGTSRSANGTTRPGRMECSKAKMRCTGELPLFAEKKDCKARPQVLHHLLEDIFLCFVVLFSCSLLDMSTHHRRPAML
jgi:hypothetical protein